MQDSNSFIIGIFYALVLFGLVIVALSIPLRYWFSGIAMFAIPQVYIFQIAGVYPSLSLVASLGAVYSFKYFFRFTKIKWFQAFIAVWFLQALSLIWSPSPALGFRHLIYLLPFAIAAFVGFSCARLDVASARKFLFFALWLSIAEAILVVIFRVVPSIELAFLLSPFAGIATSPNVMAALFYDAANNVFDSGKAGGLFVNANAASAILGFCSVLAWELSANAGMRSLRFVAVFNWIAIFFTGSKAGMMIAIVLPSIFLALETLRHHRINKRVMVVLVMISAGVITFISEIIDFFVTNDFLSNTSSTLDVRGIIWSFAGRELLDSPLLGLGFGGWEQKFPPFAQQQAINSNYPPHNAFLITWSQSGLFAMLCLLAFVVLFLHWTYRASRHPDPQIKSLASGLFLGALWFWLQAQGENFGILGEPHFTSLLGLFAGVLLAQLKVFADCEARGNQLWKIP